VVSRQIGLVSPVLVTMFMIINESCLESNKKKRMCVFDHQVASVKAPRTLAGVNNGTPKHLTMKKNLVEKEKGI
jgi:hypothetical protein